LDGVRHWEIRVEELPEFFVAGETRDEVLREYLPALEAYLDSFIEAKELPPLPQHGRWLFRIEDTARVQTASPGEFVERLGKGGVTASLAECVR